ncbi:MAG: methyltransferase domain-containing protein [Pseudomonadota bacterium]
MDADLADFAGDVPSHYDHGLGPVLFAPYSRDMAERAKALAPKRVLELAGGTGLVSRALRDALPADAALTVTDLSEGMLAVAKRKFGADENVAFAQADAMALAFPDASFDLLVCQFGVMFFPDRRHAFAEARRVLSADGAYLFSTWGPMAANPYSEVAHEVGARFFPNDPPQFYRLPFSCSDPAPIDADARAGGFRRVEHAVVRFTQTLDDPGRFARGMVYGNPFIDEIKKRGGVDPEAVVQAVEEGLRARLGPSLAMPLQALVFLARP